MVAPVLDAGIDELFISRGLTAIIQRTANAYICTRPFLLAALRFKLCIAGFGKTAFERIMSVISRLLAMSSDWGYGRFSGEHAFSAGQLAS